MLSRSDVGDHGSQRSIISRTFYDLMVLEDLSSLVRSIISWFSMIYHLSYFLWSHGSQRSIISRTFYDLMVLEDLASLVRSMISTSLECSSWLRLVLTKTKTTRQTVLLCFLRISTNSVAIELFSPTIFAACLKKNYCLIWCWLVR